MLRLGESRSPAVGALFKTAARQVNRMHWLGKPFHCARGNKSDARGPTGGSAMNRNSRKNVPTLNALQTGLC